MRLLSTSVSVVVFSAALIVLSTLCAAQFLSPPPPLISDELEEVVPPENAEELAQIMEMLRFQDGAAGQVMQSIDGLGGEGVTTGLHPSFAPGPAIYEEGDLQLQNEQTRLMMDALLANLCYADIPGQQMFIPHVDSSQKEASLFYFIDIHI